MRYEIDQHDRILGFDEESEQFATDNGAPELVQNAVGTLIWNHIKGPAVVEIYQRLFDRVRKTGIETKFPFRCDSPELIRMMSMAVSPGRQNHIVVHTVLLEEIHREPVRQPEPSENASRGVLTMCAWCLRLEHQSEWIEIEDAQELSSEFREIGRQEVSHGICPRCLDVVLKGRKRRGNSKSN